MIGRTIVRLALVALCPVFARAVESTHYVERVAVEGAFPLATPQAMAALYVTDGADPGVARAAADLQRDLEQVTGRRPTLTHAAADLGDIGVLIGVLGQGGLIDQLVDEGRLTVDDIAGQWESYVLEVVADPLPGMAQALVIAGSDKRGAIYGIYELSQQIGVSPWAWWADVPVRPTGTLSVIPGRYRRGPPAVRYRGIFLNDEAPALSGWVQQNYGGFNHRFYTRVFELLLRLKGNLLWPAMWNDTFNVDDPLNPKLADAYGIVMSTSHHEPMMRAWKEWERAGNPPGSWDYATNAEALRRYWEEGIDRTRDYEKIVTLAMRGDGDEPMSEQDNIAVLERIVTDQRHILAERINPDLSRVPQVWALYKEVQGYYEKGMRVPDDVTLLWCDDNWGNIRRLPTPEERSRTGGAGIYYHFDYVGGPRSYRWLNTTPLPKIWEQMNTARRHGADRIWIVNVGDLKPMEVPIEFFLDMAWDPDRWPKDRLAEFGEQWAEREFGPAHAAEIADIVARYTKYNARRKPELMEPDTYSLLHYREADRVLDDWREITARAQRIHDALPEEAREAFFQLVLYPAQASAQVAELWITVGRNRLYAAQGRARANALAERARELFGADAELSRVYHQDIAHGKWNHMMSQPRIGYTSWNNPPKNLMPEVKELDLPSEALPAIAVEGSADAWPGANGHPALPAFSPYDPTPRYIDVFNRGSVPFSYTAHPEQPWIRITPAAGEVTDETRLWVGVDWDQAPPGAATGAIQIRTDRGNPITVAVPAVRSAVTGDPQGFLEANGVVSIEAASYSRKSDAGPIGWKEIPDYGNTLSAMTILPLPAGSVTPPDNAPRLEYDTYLFSTGAVEVVLKIAPTLNVFPDRGLRCAVSIDDEAPRVLTAVPRGFFVDQGNWDWQMAVWHNGWTLRSPHSIAQPGPHTIKIWMVDPGLVLEKIIVNTGGLQSSALGPPESPRPGR